MASSPNFGEGRGSPPRRSMLSTPMQALHVVTPGRRALSAEPSTHSRRSMRTPTAAMTSSLLRSGGPASQRKGGLSASGRKAAVTPHAKAAFRVLDSRRAAIFTPGRDRRRSLRDQRETPRDFLRGLSRMLAPRTRVVTSSSSPREGEGSRAVSATQEAPEGEEEKDDDDDDDDDIPIDRPRLSLPIDMDDDDDDDLRPPRLSGIEDENYTVHSVELPRRATSELPIDRYARGSLGSVRISDYFNQNDLTDVGIDSGFFVRSPVAPIEEDEEEDALGATLERLDEEARRETLGAGRESGFGPIDVSIDGNETTFMMAPQAEDSIAQAAPLSDNMSEGNEPFADSDDGGLEPDMAGGDLAGFEDVEVDLEAQAGEVRAEVPSRRLKKRPGRKVSKHGIEYPSLPPGVVKRLAQSFAHTSGVGKAKISPDTLSAIMQASDWFFEQLGDDLQAYAKHAGRKTIEESDMLTLMRRQRQTSSSTTPFSLAQRYLPRELLQELRMTAPVPSKKRRKADTGGGEDVT